MDDRRFDHLARLVASRASRRSILKGLFGLGGAAAGGRVAADQIDARTIGTRPTIPPPTTRPPTTTTTTAAPCPGQQQCPDSTLCCPTGTCARSGNQAICCDGSNGSALCGLECCSQGPLQCCDRECCSTNSVCLARVFEGSIPDGEETCCPISQTCDGHCCDGTCFDPVGLPTLASFFRECCPAEATFCAGSGPFAGQGLCCFGDTPDCCHDEIGTPVCLAADQCCTSDECDGCSTCEDFACERLCSECCDAGEPADWFCLPGECCPNIPDYCSGGRFCCPEDQPGFGTRCEDCCADADCGAGSLCCDNACVDGECCNDQDCVDIGRGDFSCVTCHHFENEQGQPASSCILLGTEETEFNCGVDGFCCFGECLDASVTCVLPCSELGETCDTNPFGCCAPLICSESTGACVPPDLPCPVPCQPGQMCCTGQCVTGACCDASDCAGSPNDDFCWVCTAERQCVEADDGTACASGGSQCCHGVCFDAGVPCLCVIDDHCAPGEICCEGICVTATCCEGTGIGCGAGEVCCGDACVAGECCTQADCAGSPNDNLCWICTAERQCVEEEEDTPCASGGSTCCHGVCLDAGAPCLCVIDDHCPPGGICCAGTCTTATCCEGTGTGCEAGQICCGDACVTGDCCAPADCGASPNDDICWACTANQCVPQNNGTPCASGGNICCKGICTSGPVCVECSVDSDCAQDPNFCETICQMGSCISHDCGSFDICCADGCRPGAGSNIECSTDDDLCCPGGYQCCVTDGCCNGSCYGGQSLFEFCCLVNAGYKLCPETNGCVLEDDCCTDCSERDVPQDCLQGFCDGGGCGQQTTCPSGNCCGGTCPSGNQCCDASGCEFSEFCNTLGTCACNDGLCGCNSVSVFVEGRGCLRLAGQTCSFNADCAGGQCSAGFCLACTQDVHCAATFGDPYECLNFDGNCFLS